MAKVSANHTGLSRIQDEATRTCLRILMDRVSSLEEQAGVTPAALDAKGQRVTNVGNPRVDSDAVNLATLKQLLSDNPEP